MKPELILPTIMAALGASGMTLFLPQPLFLFYPSLLFGAEVIGYTAIPGFHVSTRNPNSGLHACTASMQAPY